MHVSVIIPTYNYARFVTYAVDSVLAQTYTNTEIIVVDDGSTDNTQEVLRQFEGKIRYVYQLNAGLCSARNSGIRVASGELVAFLDSDDMFHPRKLEWQVKALEANPTIDLIGTNYFSNEPPSWTSVTELPPLEPASLERVLIRMPFAPSTFVARKNFIELLGMFDEERLMGPAEDRGLLIRAALTGRLAYLLAPLTFYRIHASSMSANPSQMINAERAVLQKSFAMSQLAGRRWLRRRSYAYADYSAGLMALSAEKYYWSIALIMRSLLCYPLFYRCPDEIKVRFARVRLLVKCTRMILSKGIVRIWRLFRSDNCGDSLGSLK